jgi:hypothetical protein
MNYTEWSKYMNNRREIISQNRSNRLKKLPLLVVPEKLKPPQVIAAYEPDGSYAGIINSLDELPEGYKYKMVDAIR